jgi:hypothetical protein
MQKDYSYILTNIDYALFDKIEIPEILCETKPLHKTL